MHDWGAQPELCAIVRFVLALRTTPHPCLLLASNRPNNLFPGMHATCAFASLHIWCRPADCAGSVRAAAAPFYNECGRQHAAGGASGPNPPGRLTACHP